MTNWEDYYQILGVDPNTSQEKIKEAYRYKAFILHPDRLRDLSKSVRHQAEEDFKKVNQAYEVLKDPQKREKYNSEWLRQKDKAKEGFLPKPKPSVNPPNIRFINMTPGEIKRTSFIVRNLGGPYTKIWFSNPDSWVRVVDWVSLSSDDELPLRVEIEVEGKNWGKSYTEHIKVKLDEEETQVVIEIQTKPKPVESRVWTSPAPPPPSSPSFHYQPPPPPSKSPSSSKLFWRGVRNVVVGIGIAVMVLIIFRILFLAYPYQSRPYGEENLIYIPGIFFFGAVFGLMILARFSTDKSLKQIFKIAIWALIVFLLCCLAGTLTKIDYFS
jgi:DnaJ-domain-containing protein 1